MKKYTFTGEKMIGITVKDEKGVEKNVFLSKGNTYDLPEESKQIKTMVAKQILVEAPLDKKIKTPAPGANEGEEKK